MSKKKETIDVEVVEIDKKNGKQVSDKKNTNSESTNSESKGKPENTRKENLLRESKGKSSKGIWLAWLLSTSVLGASVYNLYTGGKALPFLPVKQTVETPLALDSPAVKAMVNKALAAKLSALPAPKTAAETEKNIRDRQVVDEVKATVAAVQENIAGVRKSEDESSKKIAVVQTTLAALTQQVETLQTKRTNQAMFKAQPLIADAVRLIEIQGKPKQAALFLQSAATILDQADDPQNLSHQQSLVQAAKDLFALPVVNVAKVSQQIDSLIASVDKLRLPGSAVKVAPIKPTPSTDSWQSLGNGIWQDVKGLIKVSKDTSNGLAKMVSPEAQALAYMMTKLQLQRLQLAVLSHSQAQFEGALQATLNLVKGTFDKTSSEAFVAQLQTLADTKVSAPVAPESLQAVKQLLGPSYD